MRTIVAVCLGLALAGCAIAGDAERDRERLVAKAEVWCRSIGLDQSSEKWTDCMISMVAAERRSEDARRAAAPTRVRAAQPTQGGKQGMSFMCKDAISRGDRGGTFIFC